MAGEDPEYVPIDEVATGGSAPEPRASGVEVPHSGLAPETLRSVIESFVNREGTDYGLREKTLDQKVADVMRQLEAGEAVLLFDPDDESITIAPGGQ